MTLDTEIVSELVEEIAGKDVIELVELIKGKEDVSEFKIAEKLKITVNQVRNMLYRLYSHNLVSFMRKKDKKKGWYIYYWTFDERKGYDLFVKIKKEKLAFLQERVKSESEGSYFMCPNECIRLDLERAMEYDFKCPDCGKVLEQEDNARRVRAIEKEIVETKAQLAKPYVETPKRKPRRRAAKRKPAKRKTTRRRAPAKRKPRRRAAKRKPAKRKTTRRSAPAKRKPRKKTTSRRKSTRSRRKSK